MLRGPAVRWSRPEEHRGTGREWERGSAEGPAKLSGAMTEHLPEKHFLEKQTNKLLKEIDKEVGIHCKYLDNSLIANLTLLTYTV